MLKVNINNISIHNASDQLLILKSINFELFRGKIYTILGKNGSGKSTLIKSLTGLLNKNLFTVEGEVIFDNNDILKCGVEKLREIRLNKIRYVFQDSVNSFDPLKTFKYYFDSANIDKNIINEQLEYFLLPDYGDTSTLYPYEVSGGMAQRLALVISMLINPQLLILDEPTSGIDYTIANLLLLRLQEFTQKENGTALIVTHDIGFAEKISDELAFLTEGTITGFSPKKNFFKENDIEQLNSFINAYKEIK